MRRFLLLFLVLVSVQVTAVNHTSIYWEYSDHLQLEKMVEFADTDAPRNTQYEYGLNGHLTSITKPDGTIIRYQYDFKDRMQKACASDGSFTHVYTYDLDGNIKNIDDQVSSTIPFTFEVQNSYNEKNQKIKSVYPDNSYVTFEYDNDNLCKLNRFNAQGELLYSHLYHWTKSGQLSAIQLPNERGIISYKRDYKGRILSIHSPYWSEQIDSWSGYSAEGNMVNTTITDSFGKCQWSYTYDRQNRLTHETNGQDVDNQFTYDPLNNIVAINGLNQKVDTHNQTVETPHARYTYDANGNLSSKTTETSSTFFTYDALDRLKAVTIEGSKKITYDYDSNYRRLRKKVQNGDELTTYYYIYDGSNEVGCMDAEGNILELRILGHGIGAEIGAAAAIEINQVVYLPIHDHRGNVTTLVQLETGDIAETHRYSAFGEVQSTGNISPWRFYSKRYETELELTNFGKRFYSADLAKWTTPDPLGFGDNANRYVFVNNNPINCIDLYGLFSASAFWQGVKNTAQEWYQTFCDHVGPEATEEQFDDSIKDFFHAFMGDGLFSISDYRQDAGNFGVTRGKKNDKVKITFINGILNTNSQLQDIVEKISGAHNGEQVFYIYRGTEGWSRDILRCVLCKLGFISEDAYQLARTWKRLIEELGGTDSDGSIIHYCHSVGATETQRAKKLMSPEELQMIDVITFGPATLVSDDGFRSVVNYVSKRDGVCYLDPIGYIHALIAGPDHIIFLGAHTDGYPFVDHLFQVYYNYLQDLFEKS